MLKLKNFTLAGHSTGGAIAVRYMARHNEYGVSKLALFAAAVSSLIRRLYFPHGLTKQTVEEIIKGTYNDLPKMLRGFGNIFFSSILQSLFQTVFSTGASDSGIGNGQGGRDLAR